MLIDFRQFLNDSVEKVLFKADLVLLDRNAKANTNTQFEYTVTRRRVLRYKSVTLNYVGHENAAYIKFSVFA